jgi:hypothetical protein
MMVASIALFAVAAVIDFPYPQAPSRRAKDWGNFFCSCGWTFLAIGLYWR